MRFEPYAQTADLLTCLSIEGAAINSLIAKSSGEVLQLGGRLSSQTASFDPSGAEVTFPAAAILKLPFTSGAGGNE